MSVLFMAALLNMSGPGPMEGVGLASWGGSWGGGGLNPPGRPAAGFFQGAEEGKRD